jgi:putative flippase GtrA
MTQQTNRGVLSHRVARFILVGGTNTLVTGLIVVGLSYLMLGWLAFTVAFALGIVFAVVATGRWVFESTLSPRRIALYVGAYLVIYVVGLAVVHLLSLAGAPAWANGTSVFVTAPLSFIAGRAVFPTYKKESAASDD